MRIFYGRKDVFKVDHNGYVEMDIYRLASAVFFFAPQVYKQQLKRAANLYHQFSLFALCSFFILLDIAPCFVPSVVSHHAIVYRSFVLLFVFSD